MRQDDAPASKQKQVILHPILCAVYPVVFLYTANRAFFDLSVVVWPAVTAAAAAAALWALLTRAIGDVKLAAMFTTLPLLVFFSYGAVEQAFRSSGSGPWTLLICACVGAVCLAAAALLKWRHLIDQATYMCNIVSLVLAAAPLFQAAMGHIGIASARSLLPPADVPEAQGSVGGPAVAPDIYYFVLDGYGREDVLRTDYGFDNSELISELEQRGFYVADQAVANYPYTAPSITSTLNLTYLDELFGGDLGDLSDRNFLRERMHDNRAVKLLRSAGYSVISFSSQYSEIRIDADIEMREWWFPSEFVIGLAGMTPIPSILGAFGKPLFFDLHRYRTLYPFERMEEAAAIAGPKLVFAHILYGHPPFVFGRDGRKVVNSWNYTWDDGSDLLEEDDAARAQYIASYVDQIAYLNGRLRETVDAILARSERPPIIVIHGDHGPGSRYSNDSIANTDLRERFSIFYAALLPEGGSEDLYPSISPVNGLRVVFNRYFGANYPLLEDASFFNGFSTPYRFTRVDENRLRVAH